jgi:hypothetical protein
MGGLMVADIRTCVLVRHYTHAYLGGVMAVLEAVASYVSHKKTYFLKKTACITSSCWQTYALAC